jgi:lipopolysaccharide heptosyltransferase I
MKKILLVKTSSLGDVIHNFPVASDIRRHLPEARIDWVVEEPYAALVALHPAVRRVIPVAMRRWRRGLLGHRTWKEIAEFRRLSQAEAYDAVVDTQGLVKSAVLAHAARGRRHGFDAASAREPLAAKLYDVTHHVARGQHAVRRNRLLAAAALGYRVGDGFDYGISAPAAADPESYAVLLHGSSRADKLWPEESWIDLARRFEARGMRCLLPWGDDDERGRSERIAARLACAVVPGPMALERLAGVLSGARAVAGVDTGLTHLAAALARPVAAIYCASDPRLTGVLGGRATRNIGGPGHPPSAAEVWEALAEVGAV